MISDLLLTTMSERQIEAVFAHEAGHVMHRHMNWYVVFIVVFFLMLTGLETRMGDWWIVQAMPQWVPLDLLVVAAGLGLFFVAFGSLSRSFERQADVFATRNLTAAAEDQAAPNADGVEVFSSALVHVARLNNMPLDSAPLYPRRGLRAWYGRIMAHTATWLHGTIRSRLDYLHHLPNSPETAEAFDRRMINVRLALLVALCATTVWAGLTIAR
jgi:STE24 endopeptidase